MQEAVAYVADDEGILALGPSDRPSHTSPVRARFSVPAGRLSLTLTTSAAVTFFSTGTDWAAGAVVTDPVATSGLSPVRAA